MSDEAVFDAEQVVADESMALMLHDLFGRMVRVGVMLDAFRTFMLKSTNMPQDWIEEAAMVMYRRVFEGKV